MVESFSINYGSPSREVPTKLSPNEADAGKIIAAPLYDSLPLLVQRLLAAEERIAELETLVRT